MSNLFQTVAKVADAFRGRVSTGELNRFFESVLATHPPPTMSGCAPRLYFITQAETAPPLFVVIASAPEAPLQLPPLRGEPPARDVRLRGVPVRVKYRERRRRELENAPVRGSTKDRARKPHHAPNKYASRPGTK